MSSPFALPGQPVLYEGAQTRNPTDATAASPYTLAELRGLVAERRAVEFLTDAELQALLTTSREALITLAREDINVFAALVLRDERTGQRIQQAPVHRAMHAFLDARDAEGRLKNTKAVLWGHVEAGKAVPLDTEIPTPTGWTTMGALQPGDYVFGSDGQPCSVVAVSDVQHDRDVYRVSFDDGDSVLADADHQWSAWTVDDLAAGKQPRVVTTRMMAERVMRVGGGGPQYKWKIPLTAPVQYPRQDLPVDPYVLGAWLGDGCATDTVLSFHEDDRAVYDECRLTEASSGVWTRDTRRPSVIRASLGGHDGSLMRRLRALGVIGNKHIPSVYLRSDAEQRTRLLAGLLDTDGTIDGRGGKSRVEFCVTNERLATGTLELVRSLGFKASMSVSEARLYGRVTSLRYRIWFTARTPVFKLARKLAKQKLDGAGLRHRSVVGIERVESVPVKCITVSSSDSTYLMGRSYTVTHNTQGLVIARVLWELGHDPRLRIAVFSKTANSAGKIVRSIATYIEHSEDLHMVFPLLRPGSVWRTGEIKVAGASDSKDPSVWAGGVSSQLIGARIDRFFGDDIIDLDTTRTPYLRQQTIDWYFGQVEGRLSADCRVTIVGNAWHPEDVMHKLAEVPGWSSRRFPVYDERTGALSWPSRWPMERIEQKRRGMPPTEFARAFLCRARADEDARFSRSALDTAMSRGRGLVLAGNVHAWRPGLSDFDRRRCRFYTGVDLAVSQSKRADFSAIFTLAVWPDGTREPVDVQTGRWQAAEILNRLVQVRAAWGSVLAIENVAAQEWMRQFAALAGVPSRPYATGTTQPTLHFQAEQLAAEIASLRWVIPTLPDGTLEGGLRAWVDAMLFYAPNRHVPDVLAASLLAMWLAGSADATQVMTEGTTDVLRRVTEQSLESRLGCWG